MADNKHVLSITQHLWVDLLIAFWFVRQGIDFIFLYLGTQRIYTNINILFTVITYTTLIAGIIVSLQKNLIKEAYFIITGIVILYAVNYVVHPENIFVIKTIARMTLTTVPCYMLVRSISNAKRIICILDFMSCFIIPLVAYIQVAGLNMAVDNYLDVSFSILPCMLVLIGLLYQEFRLRRFLCVVIGLFTLVVYGGRMPLLLLVFSIMVYEIKELMIKKNNIKRILKYASICVVVLITVLNINEIKLSILQKYAAQQTYSRTITRIFESNLLDLSGRGFLYKSSLQLIKKNPVLGNGIGADATMIIKERLYDRDYDLSMIGGLNTHNGIIEFALEFGVVLLIIALIFLMRGCICAFYKVKKNYDFIFLVLLFGVGIFRTLLGYPYWYSQAFWMGIAWCITICLSDSNNNNKVEVKAGKGEV